MDKMWLGISILAVVVAWLVFSRRRSSSFVARLTRAGAVRRPLSPELKPTRLYTRQVYAPAFLFEGPMSAILKPDGIVMTFRGCNEELFLPLSLISLTGKPWPHNPLTFGQGKDIVNLNLEKEITTRIQSLKQGK